MTKRIYLNNSWEFIKEYSEALLDANSLVKEVEVVRLPHTMEVTHFHYFDEQSYEHVGGYRKLFDAESSWKGKVILLTFEGIAHYAEVYLNGTLLGVHECGYTAFTIDLSNHLLWDRPNTLVVKVDSREQLNQPPFGHVIDYMTYGGIYRDVYMEIKNKTYIEDVFITTTDVLEKQKKLSCEIKLNSTAGTFKVRHLLKKLGGEEKAYLLGEAALDQAFIKLSYILESVALWEIETPNLYELTTELVEEDEVIDTKCVRFGFREAQFKEDGFYLNGKKIKLRGLNRHQSYPYVGYAMPASPQRRDAHLLKYELGLNAVRTSHYPQSQHFIDYCDEIGLLVFTEIPGWQHIGDKAWQAISIKTVEEMVVQYRNHPSIILWGVRINESPDCDTFYEKTNEVAHKLDATRATGGVRCIKKSHLLEDVYTYNDFVHEGDNRALDPKKKVTSSYKAPYLVSEYNGHMFPTKSFDTEEHALEHALRHSRVLEALAADDEIAGGFGWCMFDYNTHRDFGSGDRICYHGIMDMFRNPKLAAAVYSSQQDIEPVLEISSGMNIGEHPGGTLGKVYAFTNADSIKLYKNGKWIKNYEKQDTPFMKMNHGPLLIDDFIGDSLETIEGYTKEKAERIKRLLSAGATYGMSKLPLKMKLLALRLIVLDRMTMADGLRLYSKYIGNWGEGIATYTFEAIKDGKVVKTVHKKPMTKVELVVDVDHTELIEEHTYDVACVRIKATDENGNRLPFYGEPISLEVEGDIEMIGPSLISLKGGMAGTYIKTIGKSGKGVLHMKGNGLSPVELAFTIACK